MRNFTGLWIGKTGDANAWYHIYPFAVAQNTNILHVVRYKKALKSIPNVKYHLFNSSSTIADRLKLFSKGWAVLINNDIDYIVSFNPVPWGSIAWLLAKIFRKPLILGYIGTDFHHYLKHSRLKKILFFITNHTNIITVPGTSMQEWMRANGINSDKVYLFPHCVSDSWLTEEITNTSYAYDLITVCALNKGKRVHDIINTVKILHDRNYPLNVCIVGNGPEKSNLENYARENGVAKFIHFTGYQKDVRHYLLQSKIYVQASENEGLSLGLIEAMALGLIPVATKAGSEEDIIENGVNGYLTSIGKPKEIANAIISLLDKNNYDRVKANVLNYRHHFSMDNAVAQCQILIEKATAR